MESRKREVEKSGDITTHFNRIIAETQLKTHKKSAELVTMILNLELHFRARQILPCLRAFADTVSSVLVCFPFFP